MANITASLEEAVTTPDMERYTFAITRTIDTIYRFKNAGYSARYFYNIKTGEYKYVLTEAKDGKRTNTR